MAEMEEEEEEVLAEDDSKDTLHLNSLVGHIENIILSEYWNISLWLINISYRLHLTPSEWTKIVVLHISTCNLW